ncbi:MAG: hypothetical protein ACO3E4_03625 [Candidatus Nanopelagicaceae bacterium]
MKAEILLFVPKNENLLDKLVKFITNQNYRHAGICFPNEFGDLILEASGWKGKVLAERRVSDLKNIIIETYPVDLDFFCFWKAKEFLGTRYDYKGFFLWALNREAKKKLYCFEYILEILKCDSQIGPYAKLVNDGSISGRDIKNLVTGILKSEPIIKEY